VSAGNSVQAGGGLAAARAAVLRRLIERTRPADPAAVVEPRVYRFLVAVRRVEAGRPRRRLGEVLAQAVVSDVDAVRGRAAAVSHLRAYAVQRRVREGRAAVTVVALGAGGGW
jgi:hypothetical protein